MKIKNLKKKLKISSYIAKCHLGIQITSTRKPLIQNISVKTVEFLKADKLVNIQYLNMMIY